MYYVNITDDNGCTVTDSAEAVVFNNQSVNAGEDKYICLGTEVQLFASGGNSFAWSPGETLSATDVFNPIASPSETTTYEVVVGEGTECSGSDSVTVFVTDNESEPGTMSSDTVFVCAQQTVQLSVSNAVFGQNEVLGYVLHAGGLSEIGSILALSPDGVFSSASSPSIEPNRVYSVTPVIGPGDNLPDLDNECLKIGKGQPIVFLNPIEFEQNEICSGVEILVVTVVIGGYGEFDLESSYDITGSWIGTVKFGQGFTTTFSQSPDNSYSFTATDQVGCERTIASDDLPNCDVVPLELLSFDGQASFDHNLLSWQTASEVGVDAYQLQRSFDGTSFSTIASLPATQQSGSSKSYQHADEDVRVGITYYRLVEQSVDGMLSICSQVISLQRAAASGFDFIDIVPSITSADEVQLLIDSEAQADIQVSVFDYTGRLILETEISSLIGRETYPLNLSSLLAGAYLVQLGSDQNKAVRKLVKLY